jgi:hypothetical protein
MTGSTGCITKELIMPLEGMSLYSDAFLSAWTAETSTE